jgi:hypothetical protein
MLALYHNGNKICTTGALKEISIMIPLENYRSIGISRAMVYDRDLRLYELSVSPKRGIRPL